LIVVEMGIDVDGDGRTDLNPARIYAFGTSFGGAIAIVFMAVEPDVRAGAVTSAAGPIIENMRLSPINRPNIGTRLASRVPSLINTPGITSVGGISVAAPLFNENRPLKNQAPVINTVAGAIDIQAALDRWEWVPQPGNPLAYVRYLRKAPLDAMPAKSMLIHVPKGDQGIPNLNTSQMLLTGDLVDRSLYYRHDLAFAENPTLPKDSHAFTAGFRGGQTNIPAVVPIMLAAQEQVATFFESHGTLLIQPQPVRYFEWPMRLPLPDGLNYIP
jgi:hypothetical protein